MAERKTLQKEIIYDALCRLANHPTADEVYEAVNAEHPTISKATVYRVLNQMSENHTVKKVPITNGADHFDHQTFPHYHVKCRSCGRVCDVVLSEMRDPTALITDSAGYNITGYSLQFDGICPECKKEGE